MWTLETDEFDAMENHNPDCVESRPLKAETFEEAKKEALTLYRSLQKYKPGPYAQHRVFPRNPRLVFKLGDK